eukprot:365473-Chlamydomonas_euryale.AAC.1
MFCGVFAAPLLRHASCPRAQGLTCWQTCVQRPLSTRACSALLAHVREVPCWHTCVQRPASTRACSVSGRMSARNIEWPECSHGSMSGWKRTRAVHAATPRPLCRCRRSTCSAAVHRPSICAASESQSLAASNVRCLTASNVRSFKASNVRCLAASNVRCFKATNVRSFKASLEL